MSSRCRIPDRRHPDRGRTAALLLLAALALGACDDKKREADSLPVAQSSPAFVAVSTLIPGGGPPPPEAQRAKLYEDNPHYVEDGKRLFGWYNCTGCHFHGGGGIGPALMDNHWRYGGHLDQIYASIYQGRPNGMPTWGGKIPDAQIWEIAAYIRSLSPPLPPPPPPVEPSSPSPAGVPQAEGPGAPATPQ